MRLEYSDQNIAAHGRCMFCCRSARVLADVMVPPIRLFMAVEERGDGDGRYICEERLTNLQYCPRISSEDEITHGVDESEVEAKKQIIQVLVEEESTDDLESVVDEIWDDYPLIDKWKELPVKRYARALALIKHYV